MVYDKLYSNFHLAENDVLYEPALMGAGMHQNSPESQNRTNPSVTKDLLSLISQFQHQTEQRLTQQAYLINSLQTTIQAQNQKIEDLELKGRNQQESIDFMVKWI